jgi:hypothetical protein
VKAGLRTVTGKVKAGKRYFPFPSTQSVKKKGYGPTKNAIVGGEIILIYRFGLMSFRHGGAILEAGCNRSIFPEEYPPC